MELEQRGMSKHGLNAVLIQRLKEAVAQKVPLLADRPAHEIEIMLETVLTVVRTGN